ncbi:uncharacterized protein KY384_007344 [Bacidia gigantensis]|uniref:uncharacterized protein n=1 Tax=Bacidia gigantensis TaxID=2732470 RepID=UPI001D03B267|nr:uncharacterized protein KY384_007344 [Bacidia gigantensis]KAG8528426.1 hypothetical protein KY384_007344 [Bacidia gigantensis]
MANTNGPNGTTNGLPLEKDFSHTDALERVRTAGSVSISPELFEKLYLSPPNKATGDLRKRFGNPTPLALIGFLLSLTPLSCDLMGWRGAGGNGAASTGAFWGAFGMTLVPFFNAYGAYVTDPAMAEPQMGNPGNPLGLQTPAFNASFAFFLLFMGLICFLFLILSLRTNGVFFMIFLSLVGAFSCLAAAYWNLALVYENAMNASAATKAANLTVAGGAFAFVTCMCGWYLLLAIMLGSLDFPFSLPVGDLSRFIKGGSEKMKGSDNV